MKNPHHEDPEEKRRRIVELAAPILGGLLGSPQGHEVAKAFVAKGEPMKGPSAVYAYAKCAWVHALALDEASRMIGGGEGGRDTESGGDGRGGED